MQRRVLPYCAAILSLGAVKKSLARVIFSLARVFSLFASVESCIFVGDFCTFTCIKRVFWPKMPLKTSKWHVSKALRRPFFAVGRALMDFARFSEGVIKLK